MLMITVLAGGTGSIKLVRGLSYLCDDLNIVSNIGDNFWFHNLYICPDIDTIIYGISNILDRKRGWGIKNDTFNFINHMKKLKEPSWFKIGDRDLSTHVLRTRLIKEGLSLSKITKLISDRYGIKSRIIPISDDHIETRIVTSKGDMHLQEFWIKNKANLKISSIYYKGINDANSNKEAINVLNKSNLIVIPPANPISSIGPIISFKDFRQCLVKNRHKIVAVSPIIKDKPVSGPAKKYMKTFNIDITPVAIAKYYSDFISSFIISTSDIKYKHEINKLKIQSYETNIMMENIRDEKRLAKFLIDTFNYK